MSGVSDDRKAFLIELYNQLWNSINKRIDILWQSVGVLVGAFAVFALTEKNIISLDYATAIIVMLVGWFVAHLIDVSFWNNRNKVIIENIEKEFLTLADSENIHYYFISHDKKNSMFHYIKIQIMLGFGIGGIVLIMHFVRNVLPDLRLTIRIEYFSFNRSLPYIIAIIVGVLLWRLQSKRNKQYEKFLKKSPGKELSIKENGIDNN